MCQATQGTTVLYRKKTEFFLTLLFKLMLKIGNFNTIKKISKQKRVTNSENYRFPAHVEINVVSTWKILMQAKRSILLLEEHFLLD